MALTIQNTQIKRKRSVGFVVFGGVLLVTAAWLVADVRSHAVDTVNQPSIYTYTVTQNVEPAVTYAPSEYYNGVPGVGNTAYVASLTNNLSATFHYEYNATSEANLTWTYLAVATMRANYTLGSDGKNVSTVWSKDDRILPAVTTSNTTKTISLDQTVSVPYSQYRAEMEQYQASLQLPVTTDVQILFSVHVTGTIDGSPIDDTRSSVVSAPLDQPIFTIANQFDKTATKQVAGKAAVDTQAAVRQTERIAAGVIGVIALVAIAYGMRSKIFKSAYQRELDKIYRYHDGIIIRASIPVNLSGKRIIPVQSFDDMLNLEEEMKMPIVASTVSTEATRFTIISGEDAYAYTLGKVLVDEDQPEKTAEFASWDHPKHPRPRNHPKI